MHVGSRRHPHRAVNLLDRFSVGAVLVSLAAVLAVRLGPALVGQKTFSAMDRMMTLYPWSDGGPGEAVLNPFLGDSIDAMLPSYLQVYSRLGMGDWPLWSSLGGGGTELLATTTHPTLTISSIWFLVLPTAYAPGFVKFVEILLAMSGMYLWLRRVGIGRPGSLLAGVFYIGSGFVVAWSTWAGQSSVAAMMPAMFWAIEYFLARRNARSVVAISAVVALLLLGGFPAVAGHTLYAGALYLIVRLLAERARLGAKKAWLALGGSVAALLLGFMLSAIQFLPFVRGIAGTDLSARSQQFYSQEPARSLLSVLFPEYFYDVGYGAGTNPIEAYAFVGVGAMFFALVAVLTRRPGGQARSVVPFLAVGCLLSAALVWRQGWWTDWMSGLPIFDGNKSGRLRDIFCLFAAALAGIGADRVFRTGRRAVVPVLVAAGLSGIVVLSVALAVDARFPEIPSLRIVQDLWSGIAIVVIALVAVLFATRRRFVTGAFACVSVLAAMQLSSSVSNYWPLSDPDDFYPEREVITATAELVESDRVATSRSMFGSTSTAYGIRSATAHTFFADSWRNYLVATGYGAFGAGQTPTNPRLEFTGEENPSQSALLDRMAVSAWLTAPDAPVPGIVQPVSETPGAESVLVLGPTSPLQLSLMTEGLRGVVIPVQEGEVVTGRVEITVEVLDDSDAVLASNTRVFTQTPTAPVAIALAGEELSSSAGDLQIRVSSSHDISVGGHGDVVDLAQITTQSDGLLLSYADAHGTLWSRTSAADRIRWAGTSEVVENSDARLGRVSDPSLDTSTVVLSQPAPEGSGRDAQWQVEEDSGDRIEVNVTASGDGYLVVADGMQDGWRAEVDGVATELVDADYAFVAAFVPAGEHTVTFEYVGEGVATGTVVTAGGVVIVVALLGWSVWRPRRLDKLSDGHRKPEQSDQPSLG